MTSVTYYQPIRGRIHIESTNQNQVLLYQPILFIPCMRHPGPVLWGDQDGGEADGDVAPLQLLAPGSPPALDTEGEGCVVTLALQVHTQTCTNQK